MQIPKDPKSLELAQWIAQILDKKGGQQVSVIETKDNKAIADYLVVATGTSSRHMQTLLDSPCKELKKLGYPPRSIEGEGSSWYLADLGDILVHVFDTQSRETFDLDGLWSEMPRVDWQQTALRVSG